jgi:16S rRNA (adenine1518-N6/adenine1519-N6)-dimethyltransferase
MILLDSSSPDAFSLMNARKLLQKYKIRPNRRLGQNFLVDPRSLSKVITAAELTGEENVLEVGAGLGALTCRLAQVAQQVFSVEVDRRFLPLLEEVAGHYENVTLIYGDILELNLTTIIEEGSYMVIANIPYNITSALIRHLLESDKPAERLVLTVQCEVAERIIAEPGSLSLLAVSVQIYGKPQIAARIPAKAFYPKPKIDSAVLRVDIHPEPIVGQAYLPTLFRLARAGFGQKRKQLRNSLAGGLRLSPSVVVEWLQQAAIPPTSRAQELGLDAWVQLTQVVTDGGGLEESE